MNHDQQQEMYDRLVSDIEVDDLQNYCYWYCVDMRDALLQDYEKHHHVVHRGKYNFLVQPVTVQCSSEFVVVADLCSCI